MEDPDIDWPIDDSDETGRDTEIYLGFVESHDVSSSQPSPTSSKEDGETKAIPVAFVDSFDTQTNKETVLPLEVQRDVKDSPAHDLVVDGGKDLLERFTGTFHSMQAPQKQSHLTNRAIQRTASLPGWKRNLEVNDFVLKQPSPQTVDYYLASPEWNGRQRMIEDWREFMKEKRERSQSHPPNVDRREGLTRHMSELTLEKSLSLHQSGSPPDQSTQRSYSMRRVSSGAIPVQHDDDQPILTPEEAELRRRNLDFSLKGLKRGGERSIKKVVDNHN